MSDLSIENTSNSRQVVWDVATLALPLLGLAPLLLLHAINLWSKPQAILLPFCWLALAGFGYFERKSFTNVRWRVLLSYLALGIAALLGLMAAAWFSPLVANVSLAFVFIGWAMVRLAHSSISRILALSMLAFISVTLPFGMEAKVYSWTNSLVVRLCSSVLDIFNIFHLYQSPYLALKDHYFEIADLLGNVFSLHSMLAIAICISLVWKRPFLTSLFNMVSALIWTLLGKIVFLFTTALLSFNGIDITASILGDLILWFVFFGVFVLFLTTDAFWNSVLLPIRSGDEGVYRSTTADFFNRLAVWPGKLDFGDRSGRAARPSKIAKTLNVQPIVGIGFGIVMILLMVPAAVAIFKNDMILNRANYVAIPAERIPDAQSLPADFVPKQRQRQFKVFTRSGIMGGTSKTIVWNFGGSGVDTLVLTRFPLQGWKPDSASSFPDWKTVESKMMNDDSKWPWLESTFEEEGGNAGLFFSSQLRMNGEPYIPTEEELAAVNTPKPQKSGFLNPVILDLLNPKQEAPKPQTITIQMRFQSENSIRPEEKQMLLGKYLEARTILANRLTGISSGSPK